MGKGTFPTNGEIELHVSVEGYPDVSTLARWKESFEIASQLLYYATNQQARFATIYLHTDGSGQDPDATLDMLELRSSTSGHPTVLSEEDDFPEEELMSLHADAFRSPSVILHEFGHYGFELGDEYLDEYWNTVWCPQNQQTQSGDADDGLSHACIMGAPFPGAATRFVEAEDGSGYETVYGWIAEFCNDTNHDKTTKTSHWSWWDTSSCAEVIKDRRDIDVPSGLAEPSADNSLLKCPAITWPPTTDDAEIVVCTELTDLPGTSDAPADLAEAALYPPIFESAGDDISLIGFGQPTAPDGLELARDLSDALRRALRRFERPGPRAAEVALFLISASGESIQNVERQAGNFAANGARVFCVGIGESHTSLQLLAERTGGAYLEVANRRSPATLDTMQLVRNHLARSFDRLRYGAPIALIPRQRLIDEEGTFLVEEGSESLKLVFTTSPDATFAASVHDEKGSPVRLDWNESERGSFRTATIQKPRPGVWSVKIPSAGATPNLDLAVYSKNPRVKLGVNGWRRLRTVGETVNLRVVVRAPVAVTGLGTAEVRLSLPGGDTTETVKLEPARDGVHVATFEVTRPGAYDVEVTVRNDGGAVAAASKANQRTRVVSRFERTRHVQIHVAAQGDG